MIRAWVADEHGARETEAAAALALAMAGTAYAWVDLDCEEESSVRALLAPLGVHPLVLEDMVMEINRPKVDSYGPYLYLVVHSARWED